MYRVKDYADGWIPFHNRDEAVSLAVETGALIQERENGEWSDMKL